MNRVNLFVLDKRFEKYAKPLKQKALRVFKFLQKRSCAVDIYLVSAPKMQELNKSYRDKDAITDVIAVELPVGFPQKDSSYIGEVFLNPPAVESKGYSLEYALIHGILHLLGFRHEKKSDKMEMEKQEKLILEWLNSKY
ncbi:MAG: rRNA maturation RNase YbeY [Candidatus Colwellbacteria bacterium CG10_big_fil_rev_8_21_14_0_10_42_22]|uniref:Endoribonuclease YbeY n=1 Tax=Candidatus Colwellbacteria bacterium CG10_big_fil_rev_8_21_14_0_10_42_22 TaxID=1974540 RepID=A0A2H0VGG8_9BACT|nr:MAG: rRNA maturation RNase YbeY [Candidatus Colwellbacteria bacterium CG10_big_fil_rev_8_21_14_0_10_42_22]